MGGLLCTRGFEGRVRRVVEGGAGVNKIKDDGGGGWGGVGG